MNQELASSRSGAIEKLAAVFNEEISKDISGQEANDFRELQAAARSFLSNLSAAVLEMKQVGPLLLMDEMDIRSIISIYDSSKKTLSILQNLLKFQSTFELALDKFLKRETYLTIVTEDGSLNAIAGGNIAAIYQLASFEGGTGGRINSNSALSTGLAQNILDASLQARIDTMVGKYRDLYQTMVRRWDFSRMTEKRGVQVFSKIATGSPSRKSRWGDIYDKDHIYVQYQNNVISRTYYVTNKGWLAQGWAEAIVNGDEDDFKGKARPGAPGKENAISNIIEKYVVQDNVPAAVMADVVYNQNNGNVHLAIKSGRFSTASIIQFINLAENIIKINNPINPQMLQLAVPKLIKTNTVAEKILDILNSRAENAVEEIIKASIGNTPMRMSKNKMRDNNLNTNKFTYTKAWNKKMMSMEQLYNIIVSMKNL